MTYIAISIVFVPGFQTILGFLYERNVTVQNSCNMHLFGYPTMYVRLIDLSVYHLDMPNVFHIG